MHQVGNLARLESAFDKGCRLVGVHPKWKHSSGSHNMTPNHRTSRSLTFPFQKFDCFGMPTFFFFAIIESMIAIPFFETIFIELFNDFFFEIIKA